MAKVAVLVDGAFFLNRAKHAIPNFQEDPARTAQLICSYSHRHVEHEENSRDELYRIFYYDCPPLEKKVHLPVSKRALDFKKQPSSVFRSQLFQELKRKRKVALRLGYLSTWDDWQIKKNVLKELRLGSKKWEELQDDDWYYASRQKAVDSRIAVDIASLAFKKQVSRIILIAGDADFVPASKLARREGIDFILDPLHNHINPSLYEHIDGCHSKGLKPKPRRDR